MNVNQKQEMGIGTGRRRAEEMEHFRISSGPSFWYLSHTVMTGNTRLMRDTGD